MPMRPISSCFLGFQPSFVVTLPHIWRVYIASQVYCLTPSYGSNWGHKIADFIALIHPIQWTIANPVGTDRPAKRQKKTSCVSNGRPVPVVCTHQVARRTSFLSRQSDVIASFSFGMWCLLLPDFLQILLIILSCGKEEETVDMLWRVSTLILTGHVAGIRGRVRIFV